MKCKTEFEYEVAFVSPPAIQKGPPADIDSTEADDANDWKGAIDDLNEVLSMCDDVENRGDQGEEFATDVRDQAIEMQEWIKKNKRVSGEQMRAIGNWKDGLSRWIR